MKEAYDQLKQKAIIDSGKVEIIRRYIRTKFPEMNQIDQGSIFADAVHKLIDGNISQFEEGNRKRIKDNVFKTATNRSSFYINADEIFSSALALKDYGNDYFDSLENWVAANQDTKVTRNELMKLAEKLMDISEDELELKLNEIIEVVDEQVEIENRIFSITNSMGVSKSDNSENDELKKNSEEISKSRTKPAKMQSKKLFVEKDITLDSETEEKIDLDKEILDVLKKPKSKEEISILANRDENDSIRPLRLPGNEDIEIFSRRDADVFFKAIREKKKRKKRRKLNLNIIGSLKDAFSSMFLKIPVSETSFRGILVQLILFLTIVTITGAIYISFEGSKQMVSVPPKLTEGTQIADPYKDILDLYFTKKSR